MERFLTAQDEIYEEALAEIRSGQKVGHWMWFIFPQLKGLGMSDEANYYGITDLKEAKGYLNNRVLGNRLKEITTELLSLDIDYIDEVFAYPDNLKLFSCMTLFHQANPNEKIFLQVLEKFYGGEQDVNTLRLLSKS